MNLIDTHTHLYLPEFDADRADVVKAAVEAGVEKMFLPNIDVTTIQPMLALVREFPESCFPMIGLHPASVKEDYREQLQDIYIHLRKGLFIGVGEIGIDLYRDKKYQKEQMDAFGQQIQWAIEYDLPVAIHSRESFKQVFSVLNEFSKLPRGVFHSFTGNIKEAEYAIDKGFKLGVGGIVTFKNADLKNTLFPFGTDPIVLETDAPFLAPVPKRGKRNESRFLVSIATFLAGLFSVKPDKIARITTDNALKLFPLDRFRPKDENQEKPHISTGQA